MRGVDPSLSVTVADTLYLVSTSCNISILPSLTTSNISTSVEEEAEERREGGKERKREKKIERERERERDIWQSQLIILSLDK